MKLGDTVSGWYGGQDRFTGTIYAFDTSHTYIKLTAPLLSANGSVRYAAGDGIAIDRRDPRTELKVVAEGPDLDAESVRCDQGYVWAV